MHIASEPGNGKHVFDAVPYKKSYFIHKMSRIQNSCARFFSLDIPGRFFHRNADRREMMFFFTFNTLFTLERLRHGTDFDSCPRKPGLLLFYHDCSNILN